MNTLFIQFYQRVPKTFWITLINGFSDTYDLCKSKGDLIWVEHDHSNEIDFELPIKKGNVYVSASYTSHLYRAYLWAKENPDINFVVGGPAYFSSKVIRELPKNFILTNKSVEQWFGVDDFSYKWKLDLPELPERPDGLKHPIHLTYGLDNTCYWGNCTFCTFCKYKTRKRKNIDFEFKNLQYDGTKIVGLGTSALSPYHISNTINRLPNDFLYEVYIRATKLELDNLKTYTGNNHVRFLMGLEFPTERMWKLMKKNYETDTVLDVLKILNGRLMPSFIVGWNNLIEQDLFDLEKFMKRFPVNDPISGTGFYLGFIIFNLFAFVGTEVYDELEKETDVSFGPFHMGFWPKLNKHQIELNEKAKEIIIQYGKEKGYNIFDHTDKIDTIKWLDYK